VSVSSRNGEVGAGTVSDSYFAYNLGWFLFAGQYMQGLLTNRCTDVAALRNVA